MASTSNTHGNTSDAGLPSHVNIDHFEGITTSNSSDDNSSSFRELHSRAEKNGVYEENGILFDITVWKCDECNVKLRPGIAFYMFECFRHAVCHNCICLTSDVIQKGSCYICETMRLEDKWTIKPKYEAKNCMPLLSTDASGVFVGPEIIKHDYPAQFKLDNMPSVGEDYVEIAPPYGLGSMDYGALPGCIFNTGYRDTVIACGGYTPTLSVLTPQGVRATHTLTEGAMIKSGTFIHDDVCVICVKYNEGIIKYDRKMYRHKLRVINLDATSPACTPIKPSGFPTLSPEVERPILLFKICRQRYGVLGSRTYRTFEGNTYDINIIHIYPLDSFELQDETDTHSVQSHVLWGRRTVRLEGSDGENLNTVCVTPSRHYCLGVWHNHNVRIYSRTGLYLSTVGRYGWFAPVTPGELLYPRTVTSTGSGDVMVIDENGDIHVFTPRTESWRHLTALHKIFDCDVDNMDFIEDVQSNIYDNIVSCHHNYINVSDITATVEDDITAAEDDITAAAEGDVTAAAENAIIATAEDDMTATAEDDITAAVAEDDITADAEDDITAAAEDDITAAAEDDITAAAEDDITAAAKDDITAAAEDHITDIPQFSILSESRLWSVYYNTTICVHSLEATDNYDA